MQIVFIHGSGGTGAMWHYQSAAFAGSDAIDLPGHPEGELLTTVEACASWLKAYIDEREYDDVVLVGHSIGGAIAMQYALDHPAGLAALVLVGSGARLRVHPRTVDSFRAAIADPAKLAPTLRFSWKRVERGVRDALIARHEALGAAAFVNDFEACDRFDIMDRLGGIRVPTLALCGTEDALTPPKYSEFLTQHIDGAQLAVIEGGTHFVFLEKPDEVNRAIARFLGSI
jgi:pimeloyl-ACP methyl ester carboxylesterase